MRICKDCVPPGHGAESSMVKKPLRPAPHPGPRCATHWREEQKRRKAVNHERHVQSTYGLSGGEYAALYAFQGGKCAICRRATGASRKLSVDHDHGSGSVRGLLCRPCNSILGHARDDGSFFIRAYNYLQSPPYRVMKGGT